MSAIGRPALNRNAFQLEERKQVVKEYQQTYYQENKEKIRLKQKQNYIINKQRRDEALNTFALEALQRNIIIAQQLK